MLHIFLFILKIIGLLLLIILALVCLVILLLLFAPLRYVGSGEAWRDESGQRGKGLLRLRYLGPLLLAEAGYDGDGFVRVRILGMTVYRQDGSSDSEETADRSGGRESEREEIHGSAEEREPEREEIHGSVEEQETEESFSFEESGSKPASGASSGGRKDRWKGIRSLPRQVDRLRQLWHIGADVWSDAAFRRSLRWAWKRVRFVLLRYAPKVEQFDVCFGTKDPATTGKILGGICALEGMTGLRFWPRADFQSETLYLEGQWKVRGKIRLCHLARLALYYFTAQEVKYLRHTMQLVRRRFRAWNQ